MTPRQINFARHALGLDGTRVVSYRNYFVTGAGSSDYRDWLEIVANGDATSRASKLFGGDDIFYLTRSGAEKALRPGERLDVEDFPK